MSEIAYPKLTAAQDIFKDVVWKPLLLAGQAALVTAVPFLKWPVISTVEKYLFDEIADYIFYQLVLFVDVTAIKFVNSAHQAAYDKASVALKIIAHDRGLDSSEYKKAKEETREAFGKLVRFGATT